MTDRAASGSEATAARRSARIPNAERHARSRAALVATARSVFGSEGYEAASTESLVAGTGLTRGAIYYHFADKKELFDAVITQVAAEIAARIDRVARSAPTALDGLRLGCDQWFTAMAVPQVRRIYLVEGPAVLGLARWREIDNQHGGGSLRAGIAAVIDERGEHELRVEPLTALLAGALNEAAMWVHETPTKANARHELARTLDILLSRLFAPTERPQA